LTLDDLQVQSQYCNRKCIGCSASSLATAGLLVISWRFEPAKSNPVKVLLVDSQNMSFLFKRWA